jgi:hypothetical protein
MAAVDEYPHSVNRPQEKAVCIEAATSNVDGFFYFADRVYPKHSRRSSDLTMFNIANTCLVWRVNSVNMF